MCQQGSARIVRIPNQLKSSNRGACKHGWGCSRVDEAPSSIANERDGFFAGGDKCAGHAKGLAKGSDHEIGLDTFCGGQAPTARSEHAESMCFVDEEACIKATGEGGYVAQWRGHAVHREEGVCNDQSALHLGPMRREK